MKKIILLTAILLSATAVQAQVAVTNSGDLSSVTRYNFRTGKIDNPKTASQVAVNASLNYWNGYFKTGSQVYKNSGTYNFIMPAGFSKALIVGCGAGGFGETQTGLSSVAATGGGGSGNCYRITVTKNPGGLITFYVPAAGDPYNPQLNIPTSYIRRDIGFNGNKGALPTWNNGWVNASGAAGAGTPTRGWSTGNGDISEALAHGAELVIASEDANGYQGGVSIHKIYNSNFSQECHPGRGGDGIPVGNNKVPVAAEGGCVMVLW